MERVALNKAQYQSCMFTKILENCVLQNTKCEGMKYIFIKVLCSAFVYCLLKL